MADSAEHSSTSERGIRARLLLVGVSPPDETISVLKHELETALRQWLWRGGHHIREWLGETAFDELVLVESRALRAKAPDDGGEAPASVVVFIPGAADSSRQFWDFRTQPPPDGVTEMIEAVIHDHLPGVRIQFAGPKRDRHAERRDLVLKGAPPVREGPPTDCTQR